MKTARGGKRHPKKAIIIEVKGFVNSKCQRARGIRWKCFSLFRFFFFSSFESTIEPFWIWSNSFPGIQMSDSSDSSLKIRIAYRVDPSQLTFDWLLNRQALKIWFLKDHVTPKQLIEALKCRRERINLGRLMKSKCGILKKRGVNALMRFFMEF